MGDFDLGDALAVKEMQDKIKAWVALAPGEFNTRDIDIELDIKPVQKSIRTVALEGLVKSGILARTGKRRGWYRPAEGIINSIDFVNADDKGVDIWLPFRLDHMVEIMPGNIIIIAGEPNAGKTALILNIIKNNLRKFAVKYFSSEMAGGELKKRLMKFENIMLDDWCFEAFERDGDFADVIFPGQPHLNIIDYLEVHDNFYLVGQMIKEIHSKLNGAIAIIALQKNPGVADGLGGKRSMEKARLALSVSPGLIKVTKAKNFKTDDNPNGAELKFKLVNGCKLVQVDGWAK